MVDYAAASAAFRKFKSALTRAKNKKDHAKVLDVVKEFYALFDAKGWPLPDDWALFERAKEDADYALRRAADTW